ncbi:hypothetical protein C8J57DRAFT_1330944 [Mycena rebaudengoi]|nr:hypothetical protein C8J57DRAFT_1330944 [Mycena rebaudengoi]
MSEDYTYQESSPHSSDYGMSQFDYLQRRQERSAQRAAHASPIRRAKEESVSPSRSVVSCSITPTRPSATAAKLRLKENFQTGGMLDSQLTSQEWVDGLESPDVESHGTLFKDEDTEQKPLQQRLNEAIAECRRLEEVNRQAVEELNALRRTTGLMGARLSLLSQGLGVGDYK